MSPWTETEYKTTNELLKSAELYYLPPRERSKYK